MISGRLPVRVTVISMVLVVLALYGCAKRPTTPPPVSAQPPLGSAKQTVEERGAEPGQQAVESRAEPAAESRPEPATKGEEAPESGGDAARQEQEPAARGDRTGRSRDKASGQEGPRAGQEAAKPGQVAAGRETAREGAGGAARSGEDVAGAGAAQPTGEHRGAGEEVQGPGAGADEPGGEVAREGIGKRGEEATPREAQRPVAGGVPAKPSAGAGVPGQGVARPGGESAEGEAGRPGAEVAGREPGIARPGEAGASAKEGDTTPGAREIGEERPAPGQTAESPAGRGERVDAPLQPGPGVAGARPEITEFTPTPTLGDVFFDFDGYDIRPEDARILDANIDWLRSHADHLVLIEGHCDERGTNEYNIALGDHRARATRNYLVAHGIAEGRIVTFSYGEERPFCIERAEECWAQNRRAHFLVKAQ